MFLPRHPLTHTHIYIRSLSLTHIQRERGVGVADAFSLSLGDDARHEWMEWKAKEERKRAVTLRLQQLSATCYFNIHRRESQCSGLDVQRLAQILHTQF